MSGSVPRRVLWHSHNPIEYAEVAVAMPEANPNIAQRGPYGVDLEAGKPYFWCVCGNSTNQPFCDGSHKRSAFSPVRFQVDESATYYLCGCKHTGDKPFCDGTHLSL